MGRQQATFRLSQGFKQTSVGSIPVDWALAKIGDIANVNPESLGEESSPDMRLRYIDISTIDRPGKLGVPREIAFKDAPSRARRIVRRGDILVSTVRPYLRAFARIATDDAHLVASTGFAVIRPHEDADGDFIYNYILTPSFVEFLKNRMVGSNYPAVSAADVADCPIPLPPPSEQVGIARVLSSVDYACELAVSEADLLRRLEGQVIRTVFSAEALALWRQSPLRDILMEPIRNGYSPLCPAQATGLWTLELGALSENGFLEDRVKPAPPDDPKIAMALLGRGDLLVSRSNTRDLVGMASIYGGVPANCIYPDLMMRVRVLPDIMGAEFLLAFLNSPNGRRYFKKHARGTSGSMVKINGSILSEMPIPIPPVVEQRRIVDRLRKFRRLVEEGEDSSQRLAQLKDSLIRELLTGRKRVT